VATQRNDERGLPRNNARGVRRKESWMQTEQLAQAGRRPRVLSSQVRTTHRHVPAKWACQRQTSTCMAGYQRATGLALDVSISTYCWLLTAGCWMLAAGCWMMNPSREVTAPACGHGAMAASWTSALSGSAARPRPSRVSIGLFHANEPRNRKGGGEVERWRGV
jgi:hypothetical protein